MLQHLINVTFILVFALIDAKQKDEYWNNEPSSFQMQFITENPTNEFISSFFLCAFVARKFSHLVFVFGNECSISLLILIFFFSPFRFISTDAVLSPQT